MILFLILLSGCSSLSYVQYRCVVHAVGIDYEKGEYEVTFQIYSPEKGGSGPQDASQKNVSNVKTKGKTLFEAKRELEHKVGREAFFGNTELIVFGDSMKNSDLSECLGFLSSVDEIFAGVDVCMSERSAFDLLNCSLAKNNSSAQIIREAINACVGDGIAMRTTLATVYNSLKEGFDLAIAVIGFKDSKDDYSIEINSSRVLSEGIIKGKLDSDTVRGIRLLLKDAKDMTIEIDDGEEKISVNISSIKIKREVNFDEDMPIIKLKISFNATPISEKAGGDIKNRIDEKIIEICKRAYGEVSPKMLRTEQALRIYAPSKYRKSVNFFDEYVKKAVFSIEITSNVEGFR